MAVSVEDDGKIRSESTNAQPLLWDGGFVKQLIDDQAAQDVTREMLKAPIRRSKLERSKHH